MRTILILNAGSSTLKYACYRAASAGPEFLFRSSVKAAGGAGGIGSLALKAFADVTERIKPAGISMIGHRIVHGGPKFVEPRIVDDELISELERLAPLDPTHLPVQLDLLQAAGRAFPDVQQTVCFDTAFHRSLPDIARRIPIPDRLCDELVQRFGFHGISYAYLLRTFRERFGPKAASGRLILAHLGSGSSLAALNGGRCVETTMGFTPTGGIPMQTRSGDLDPGVLLYIMRNKRIDVDTLDTILNKESGIRAVAGNDRGMKELIESRGNDARASFAITFYCYHVRRAVASLAAAMGGLDALVFSGGIGENSPEVRDEVLAGLSFLGNFQTEVMATDEEVEIAREAYNLSRKLHE